MSDNAKWLEHFYLETLPMLYFPFCKDQTFCLCAALQVKLVIWCIYRYIFTLKLKF